MGHRFIAQMMTLRSRLHYYQSIYYYPTRRHEHALDAELYLPPSSESCHTTQILCRWYEGHDESADDTAHTLLHSIRPY